MGITDTVLIEEGVELPEFHEDPSSIRWQTKSIGHPYGKTYKISSDGRLLRRDKEYRARTQEEKMEEAERHGFDSWSDYKRFHAELLESDNPFQKLNEHDMPFTITEDTIDEEAWKDHEQHGSFSFYTKFDGTKWSYEARFTGGDLDEIILLDRE